MEKTSAIKQQSSSSTSKRASGRNSAQQQDTGNLPVESNQVSSAANQLFEPVQQKSEIPMIVDQQNVGNNQIEVESENEELGRVMQEDGVQATSLDDLMHSNQDTVGQSHPISELGKLGSSKDIQAQIDNLKSLQAIARIQEKEELARKRDAKASDKNDSASRRMMRDTTKQYVRGSNKELGEDDVIE